MRAAIHAALGALLGRVQGPLYGFPHPRGTAYGAALGVTLAAVEGTMAVGVSHWLAQTDDSLANENAAPAPQKQP